MPSDDLPDWLPAKWTMEIKKIDQGKVKKCYVDPEGHRCYSKPQVFDYLKKINSSTATKETADCLTVDLTLEPDVPHTNEDPESLPRVRSSRRTAGSSRKKYDESEGSLDEDGSPSEPRESRRENGVSKWLPDGWIVEVKTQKSGSRVGMRYKCYTDPTSGQKFFSKPQVLNHLAKTNGSAAVSRKGEKSSTKPDKSPGSEATEVKNNKTEKKTGSLRSPSDYEVISRTPVEGLPPGWIKEIRLRKRGALKKTDPYYLDPLSDYMFFSKKDALRYLDSGDVKKCAMRPLKRNMNEEESHNVNPTLSEGELASPTDPSQGTEISKTLPDDGESGTGTKRPVRSITGGSFSTPGATRTEEVSEWLPDGWVVEEHVKTSGMKFKIYKESASGKKLYSKPQVLNYLASGNNSNSKKRKVHKFSISPNSSQNSARVGRGRPKKNKSDIENSNYKEVISTSPANGLPPGWIKEIRTKIYATHERTDPFYTDPVSGYIFRSKLDGLRFLETGNVELCAIRPKMKDKDGNEVFVFTNDVQKTVKSATKKQLFEDKGDNSSENKSSESAGVGRPKRFKKKKNATQNSDFKEVITTSPADGLPPGWIKEIRTKIYASHKRNDPFYTDPVSGYIFRSKLDALRFLETGNVELCAIRPKMKDKDGNEVFVFTPDAQKPAKTATKKKLAEDKDIENSTEKQQNDASTDNTKNKLLIRIKKRNSPITAPARSSKRQKGIKPENTPSSEVPTEDINETVKEKQVSGPGVNMEKQGDDGNLSFDIPEDDSWTNQCLDFAVKTLTSEILFNGQPIAAPLQEEIVRVETSVKETPTKVN